MRRRVVLLVAVLLAAGNSLVFNASPVAAWTVCAGAGKLTVTPGLLNPVAVNLPTTPLNTGLPQQMEVLIGSANRLHGFAITMTGTCTHDGLPSNKNPTPMTGALKGYCGLATGRGLTANGDLFAFSIIGTNMVMTGHVVGKFAVTVNAIKGESCVHGHPFRPLWAAGATSFTLAGKFTMLNCTADLETLLPGTPSDFERLTPIITTSFLPVPQVHFWVDAGVHTVWNHQCFGSPVLFIR